MCRCPAAAIDIELPMSLAGNRIQNVRRTVVSPQGAAVKGYAVAAIGKTEHGVLDADHPKATGRWLSTPGHARAGGMAGWWGNRPGSETESSI